MPDNAPQTDPTAAVLAGVMTELQAKGFDWATIIGFLPLIAKIVKLVLDNWPAQAGTLSAADLQARAEKALAIVEDCLPEAKALGAKLAAHKADIVFVFTGGTGSAAPAATAAVLGLNPEA